MKRERSCMICGTRQDLASHGEIVLCRRCLTALYRALVLKLEPGCGRMDASEEDGVADDAEE